MKGMKGCLWLLGLFLPFSLAIVKQASAVPDLQQWTDTYIASLPPANHFRGSILVARDGNILLRKSYGFADESWRVPNVPEGKFEIASVSKQFTAVAILQLAEAGKLAVTDRVSRFYPRAPQSWKNITIAELLSHTSGIPNNSRKDFPRGLDTPLTQEELLQTFANRPLAFAPGTRWAYTNTEYYLLAYIIEKLSGESYAAYLDQHIFKPLGMQNSGFVSTRAVLANIAIGYTRQNGQLLLREPFDRSLETGAGGIYSTLDDLYRWNQALDHPGFLQANSLQVMFRVHPPGNYGFGWFIDERPVRREYHEGGDPGFAAFEARYPQQRVLIIILANEDDAPVREIAASVARRLGLP